MTGMGLFESLQFILGDGHSLSAGTGEREIHGDWGNADAELPLCQFHAGPEKGLQGAP